MNRPWLWPRTWNATFGASRSTHVERRPGSARAKWTIRHPVAATIMAFAGAAVLGGFLGAVEIQRRWNEADRAETKRIIGLQSDGTAKVLAQG